MFTDARLCHWLEREMADAASEHEFFLHAWCIMPDHVHFVVKGAKEQSNLLRFIMSFKQATAHEAARRFGLRLWQRSFYDHRIRRDEQVEKVAAYVWMNPVRKGLCANAMEYPFSGSLTGAWKLGATSHPSWSPPWSKGGPEGRPYKTLS